MVEDVGPPRGRMHAKQDEPRDDILWVHEKCGMKRLWPGHSCTNYGDCPRPRPADERDIETVVAWLRANGAGEEDDCLRCDGEGYWDEPNPLPGYSPGPPPMTCPYCAGSGRVVVVPVAALSTGETP